MAVLKPDGSWGPNTQALNQAATGSPVVPQNINVTSPLAESYVTSTSDLTNYPIVNNPATDNVALDTTTYPQATGALLGYASGHRVRVTYFQQLTLGSQERTNVADYLNEINMVNVAYARINNFEITLQNAFNFDYSDEKGNANLEGRALIYPHFMPLIGDIFLYPVGEGKLMMLRVSECVPLSWRNEHYTQISFYSFSYASTAKLAELQASTRYTYWFDKTSYLFNGATLLEESYYRDLRDLRTFRPVLVQYYYRKFFNEGLNTYVRPDGLYDPYVTEYMAGMCSVISGEVSKRPMQLYRDVFMKYDNTIWRRLLDPHTTSIEDLSPFYTVDLFTTYANSIMVSPLIDRSFLKSITREEADPYFNKDSALTNLSYPLSVNPTPLSNPNCSQNPLPAVTTYPFFNGGQPFGYYVFTDNFYNGNIENMTPFELLVWNTIRTKQLPDSGSLLTLYIRQYLNLSPMDAFYHIPIYLRLIDMCVLSIARKPPTLGL